MSDRIQKRKPNRQQEPKANTGEENICLQIFEEVEENPKLREEVAQLKKNIKEMSDSLHKAEQGRLEAEQSLTNHASCEEEKLKCHICHSKLSCPLRICKNGHFACAKCIAQQLKHCGTGPNIHIWYSVHLLPFVKVTWDTHVVCGLCKRKDKPKYPGAFIHSLIDSNCNRVCEFCNHILPQAEFGTHLLTCESQLAKCPMCEIEMPIFELTAHAQERCQRLQCRLCKSQMNRAALESHMTQHQHLNLISSLLAPMIRTISQNIDRQDDSVMSHNGYHSLMTAFIRLAQVIPGFPAELPPADAKSYEWEALETAIKFIQERFSSSESTSDFLDEMFEEESAPSFSPSPYPNG